MSFGFLRLVLKAQPGLQQHEDRPSQGRFFVLLRKWAKRHIRADFGHKLVAHLNSAHVAKTNLNNVREVGAGSQCKSMRVRRDKQPSAGDGCCGVARPLVTSPLKSQGGFTPVASLQISFVHFFLLDSAFNEPGSLIRRRGRGPGWACRKVSFSFTS